MTRPSSRTPSPPTGGQLCTLFAVDIAGFTGPHRDDDIRLYLHEELYRMLEKAFDGSGISWNCCFHEDRGDGVLVVVPPGIACTGIIDPLPERLRGLIRRHNHVFCEAAGIQLRAAAHVGPVHHDGHGFISSDINLLFRMPRPHLDLSPARRLSAASPHAADLVRTCAGRLRGARLPWSWPVTAARQGQGKREHTSG